jgi:superfamily II DNA or RNA helicase
VVALLLTVAMRQGGPPLVGDVLESPAERIRSGLADWLARLEPPASRRASPLLRVVPSREIVYQIALPSFAVQPSSATRTKRDPGAFTKPTPIRDVTEFLRTATTCEADIALFAWVGARGGLKSGLAWSLSGREGAELLERVLATGRALAGLAGGRPLTRGANRTIAPEWKAEADGSQRAVVRIEPPVTAWVPLDPPWYFDARRGECGPLDSQHPSDLLLVWESAPPLPAAALTVAAEVAGAALARLGAPAPIAMDTERLTAVVPTPVLRLGAKRRQFGWVPHRDEDPVIRWAHVELDYAGVRVRPGVPGDTAAGVVAERLRVVPRDRAAESRALRQVGELTTLEALDEVEPLGDDDPLVLGLPTVSAWLRFLAIEADILRAAGWLIEGEEALELRVEDPEEWYADISEAKDDWFGVELGIRVGGRKISLVPILRDLLSGARGRTWLEEVLQSDRPLLMRVETGVVRMPIDRVRLIATTLLELYGVGTDREAKRLRVPALRALEVVLLAGEEWSLRAPQALRENARRLLQAPDFEPPPVPAGLVCALRPYQRDGLAWLQFLRHAGMHGILADDMGLGKTVQALAHILTEVEAGRVDGRPCLVIAPTSLMHTWQSEAARFTPALRVHVSHGLGRRELLDTWGDFDLVVTSYPLLARDAAALVKQPFHLLVLDEAQFVKNPKSQAALVVSRLDARHRICLTGTPLENHLGELWSIFHFLLPGLLGDSKTFTRVFRTPIEKRGDADQRRRLAARVRPFLLRRTKDQVEADLPPKTEIVRVAELAGAQRDLYETIRSAMAEKVKAAVREKGLSRSHIIVLDALLKLRQVCCDPGLLSLAAARGVRESAKLDLLMDLLPQLLEEGRHVLLFSQFTSMLDRIETRLEARGVEWLRLDGNTKDRATPVARFQRGEVPLFLISLRAGGTGLTLTAADTVIHYDPWWNPAVENQATDRAHRIGQDKPVFVYRLLTAGTIEERIVALQQHKADLARGILEGTDTAALPRVQTCRRRLRQHQEHRVGHDEQRDDAVGRGLQEHVPQRHGRDRGQGFLHRAARADRRHGAVRADEPGDEGQRRSTPSRPSTATSPPGSPTSIDMLAVYVNKDNPVKGMTCRRWTPIFSKTARAATEGHRAPGASWGWKASGRPCRSACTAATRPPAPTASSRSTRCSRATTRTVKEQPGSSAVVQGVASDKFGIGYSGIGYKTADVRAVPLAVPEGERWSRPFPRTPTPASTRWRASCTCT